MDANQTHFCWATKGTPWQGLLKAGTYRFPPHAKSTLDIFFKPRCIFHLVSVLPHLHPWLLPLPDHPRECLLLASSPATLHLLPPWFHSFPIVHIRQRPGTWASLIDLTRGKKQTRREKLNSRAPSPAVFLESGSICTALTFHSG